MVKNVSDEMVCGCGLEFKWLGIEVIDCVSKW